MPQVVEVPGMGDVEFPDDMSDDQITAAIQKNMAPQRNEPLRGAFGNPSAQALAMPRMPPPATNPSFMDRFKGLAFGSPEATLAQRLTEQGGGVQNVAQAGTGAAEGATNAASNIPASMAGGLNMSASLLGGRSADESLRRFNQTREGLTYQPRTYLGQQAAEGISTVAGVPGAAVHYGADKVFDVTGSPLAAATAETAGNAALMFTPSKGAMKAGGEMFARTPKAPLPEVPTTAQLRAASNAAYKAADESGVVIAPHSTAKVVGIFKDVADAENLGKLPPKLKEASDVLRERADANQPMTLKDADKVRQLINDAKASTDASDRRLAKIVQGKYDAYLNGLTAEDTLAGDAPTAVSALKNARDIYRRQKNSEMVDSIEKRAGNTGEANYTQAGSEAALRREFLKIVNNEKKARLFTPEQQAAMQKVAAPGKWANTLRNIGKTDPMKGGIPAVSASIVGGGLGSVLGPAGAIGGGAMGPALLGALSHIANRGTQAITRGNVLKAREALVGRGLPDATKTAGRTAARATPAVLKDLRQLDADLAALPKSEPFDSPRRQALERRAKYLQAELLLASPNAASQR